MLLVGLIYEYNIFNRERDKAFLGICFLLYFIFFVLGAGLILEGDD
jgi:hypothetical protein